MTALLFLLVEKICNVINSRLSSDPPSNQPEQLKSPVWLFRGFNECYMLSRKELHQLYTSLEGKTTLCFGLGCCRCHGLLGGLVKFFVHIGSLLFGLFLTVYDMTNVALLFEMHM